MGPPPNPANLQTPQPAGSPSTTQPGASGYGKSVSHLEVSRRLIEFLITRPLPQSSQSSSYHDPV